MTDRRYEALARFDLSRRPDSSNANGPSFELVLELDACRAGLCRIEGSGSVALLDAYGADDGEDLAAQWTAHAGACCGAPAEAFGNLPESARTQEALWNNYVSGGRLASTIAFEPAGSDGITCAQLDEAFAPARERLAAMLSWCDEAFARHGVDEGALRILEIGRLAACAPARLIVRERLSGDPFLSDDRFAALPEGVTPDGALDEGLRLCENARALAFSITLECLGRNGEARSVVLARENEKPAAPDAARYSEPICYFGSDSLTVRMGEEIRLVPIPFAPASQADALRAAVVSSDGAAALALRRTNAEEAPHLIALSNEGRL